MQPQLEAASLGEYPKSDTPQVTVHHPHLAWVLDANGNMEYTSAQWREFSGIEDIAEAWENMIHPEDKDSVTEAWELHRLQGIPFKRSVRLKNRDGEYRWHSSIAEPVTDELGKVIKWYGTLLDIHDKKDISEIIENEVFIRTQKLIASNRDLHDFAGIASHDLKEPIRKISIFSSLLRSELDSSVSSKALAYLSRIESVAERMHTLIDNMLLYASLDGVNKQYELVDLNEVLTSVKDTLEVPIMEKKAEIIYAHLSAINGLPFLMFQLFYNLIGNALKFSRKEAPPVITITQEETANSLIISVSDNGIGFDNKMAQQIFEPFKRLHDKNVYAGTGLGLATCMKIAERHHANLYAKSNEGSGSTFVIEFPLDSSVLPVSRS